MKLISTVLLISVLTASSCRYKEDLQDTVFSEYKASELNRKYEWFKNAHAKLTSLQAQIEGKKGQIAGMELSYAGVPRKDWARHDSQTLSIAQQELFGITSAFNNLAAEYNAEMAKFHTAFTNAGTIPAGSTLPREVIQYK